MANKYKDFRTADTLTTMSPYITYSGPDTSPPPPRQKLIRDELDPSFTEGEVRTLIDIFRAARGCLYLQNTKQKLFCLERFTTE